MERPIPDRNRRYTVEEYLALDEISDVKYEYWDGLLIPHGGWETDDDGRIIGMAGGTEAHSDIGVNLIRELGNALKGTACEVGSSDLRIWSPRSGRYHYPDVSVTCGPRVFHPVDGAGAVVNPRVLIEVLSKWTADTDRGEKFREYIEIESLQGYVLVAQDRPRVETFRRDAGGKWTVGPWFEGLEAGVDFPSLGVTVPMADIYTGVSFPSVGKPAER
jgi:Uma2 family endonuclease